MRDLRALSPTCVPILYAALLSLSRPPANTSAKSTEKNFCLTNPGNTRLKKRAGRPRSDPPCQSRISSGKDPKYLTPDQVKLYTLIWRRFIASQMNPAIYDTVSADIATNKDLIFRANGSTIKFQGFLAVYEEKQDEEEEEAKCFPLLTENQPLQLLNLTPEQSFTKPPARSTEASLVKELEKSGIGRPSTYATIMQKIQSRDYTVKEKGALHPTELGRVIARMLEDNFGLIMDITFTATMEDNLSSSLKTRSNGKSSSPNSGKSSFPLSKMRKRKHLSPKSSRTTLAPIAAISFKKFGPAVNTFTAVRIIPSASSPLPSKPSISTRKNTLRALIGTKPAPNATKP